MKIRMTECAIKLALTAVLALAIPAFPGCMDHAIGNDDVATYSSGRATQEADDRAVV